MLFGGVFFLRSSGVQNEGWFDPWMLLNAFRKKVKSMGVTFMEADVVGVDVEDSAVEKVKVRKSVPLRYGLEGGL